jgi:hypothetical protein
MGPLSLVIIIDACGWLVAERSPALLDLAPARRLRSVLGYSSACIPSLISGLWPEEHLHWSFFTRGGPNRIRVPGWVRMIPSGLRDRGRVRGRLSPFVARASGFTGYFQLYQMPLDQLGGFGHGEPKDIFAPGGLNHGTSFVDDLAATPRERWWQSDWHAGDAANWAGLEAAVRSPDRRFAFAYITGLDGWLHDHGRQHAGLPAQLDALAARVRSVRAAATAHHDAVRLLVVADHGMCTVTRHLDLFPRLAGTGLGTAWHGVLDSTMVRAWYADPAARERVRNALANVAGLRLLGRDELAREHCTFPDTRYGEDLWLVDPGVLLVPSHMGRTPLVAMHGYTPDHEDSDAWLACTDPMVAPDSIVAAGQVIRRWAQEAAR